MATAASAGLPDLKAKGWGLGCPKHTHLVQMHHIRAACSMMEPTYTANSLPMVDSDASSESWERVHEDSDAMPPECVGAPLLCWTSNQLQRGKRAACKAPRSFA